MAKSARASAAARIRQLSCLRLTRESVIPELLRELHAFVPSFSNTFFFADKRGAVDNAYFETPAMFKLFPYYKQEFHERRERQFKGLAFSEASRTQFGVHDRRSAVAADERTFERSDYYNLICRPSGYNGNFLRLYFRDAGRVLGGVTMWRSSPASEWTPEDRRRLASVESFFVHALAVPPLPAVAMVEDGDRGLIVADATGKPIYFSSEGRRLLFLAANPRSLSSGNDRAMVLPLPVAQICRNLARIFADDASASAPTYYHSNLWGGFTFRADWLDKDDPASGQIGITISHKAPLPVRLTRSVAKFGLSQRQAEVCVLMASGASTGSIAERLGISKHTANEHGRWVYNKLDVHSRAELLTKLLEA